MLGKLLFRYLFRYRWLLLGVFFFQFLSAFAALLLPRINADIINGGVALGDTDYIVSRGGLMLLISFGQILFSGSATYLAARAAMGTGRDIRRDVFNRVSSFSERTVSRFGPGTLITRNTNDVQQVQMLAMMALTMLVTAPLLAIGGIIMALQQDVGLSWLVAVAVPVLLAVGALIITRMVPLFRLFQGKLDSVNRILREQLTGIRVVRAFVREESETERFREANTEIMVVGRKVGALFVLLMPLAMLVLNITVVGVIWFGGIQVDAGRVQIGTLFAFMQYVGQILLGVLMATFMTVMIPRAAVSADRITEVLAFDDTLIHPENPIRDFPTPGTVQFRGVWFSHPGAELPTLRDVSFSVERGETLAVIGSTGSGKTTLISLIPRLFDPDKGQILVGGVQLQQAQPEKLWQTLGLIPQKAFLFSGTVAENLRFGREDASDEELRWALGVAQAADFVEKFGGLETQITQGGTNLSGGQRQRLAIARALIRRPDILLFDDSFSALDVVTDARLRQAIFSELPKATKIIVASRVSTITQADRILVLDNGSVVGLASHEELLGTNDTYQEILASQLGVNA